MSRLYFSVQHNLPRKFLINSLDCMKSLHFWAPIPSPYDFWTVSALYTQFSMYPCWNQQLQIQFLIMFNPCPCQSLLTTNQNLKSPKPSTPKLTTVDMPINYCILSADHSSVHVHLPASPHPHPCHLHPHHPLAIC